MLCVYIGYVKSIHQPENELILLHVLEIDVGKISKYIIITD